MASCSALTALNLEPTQTLSPSSSSSFSLPGRRQLLAGSRVIRSAMRIYKGKQMREQRLTEMIEKKVVEAKRVCGEDDTLDECKVAWDEVGEDSQAKAVQGQ